MAEQGDADLATVAAALRASWGRDTCDPAEPEAWTPEVPSYGQCGVTALVLNDLFGGDLLLAEVRYPDGSRQGVHYWNVLPDGREVDLTRDQFTDEVVGPPTRMARPVALPKRGAEQYLLLRSRVLAALDRPAVTAVE